MTSKLNTSERELLQRHYDGALSANELDEAEALLTRSSQARIFVSALEELTIATKGAERFAWESADAPSAAIVVEYAIGAADLSEASMTDLAPLLERFHDGEAMPEEEATVHALLRERDDVADYLAELEGLSAGIEVGGEMLADAVDFGGFWDAVSAKIDAVETAYDADEHRVLLYRYDDGEASAAEIAQVEAWIADGDEEVARTLAALDEVEVAATCAIEFAQEQVDMTDFWYGVEAAIDDEIESQGENVVSLGRKRTEKKTFFQQYQQAIVGAVAAVLVVGVAAMFSGQIFGPQETRIIEKTIVVVEEVEYAPGTTGAVLNPPVQQASATIQSDEAGAEEEQEPTVIWVFEDEPAAEGDRAPADSATDAPADEAPEEDAGSFGGQPI